MENINKRLFGATCFLGGMIIGFIISPVKKGLTVIISSGNECKNSVGEPKEEENYNQKYVKEEI